MKTHFGASAILNGINYSAIYYHAIDYLQSVIFPKPSHLVMDPLLFQQFVLLKCFG